MAKQTGDVLKMIAEVEGGVPRVHRVNNFCSLMDLLTVHLGVTGEMNGWYTPTVHGIVVPWDTMLTDIVTTSNHVIYVFGPSGTDLPEQSPSESCSYDGDVDTDVDVVSSESTARSEWIASSRDSPITVSSDAAAAPPAPPASATEDTSETSCRDVDIMSDGSKTCVAETPLSAEEAEAANRLLTGHLDETDDAAMVYFIVNIGAQSDEEHNEGGSVGEPEEEAEPTVTPPADDVPKIVRIYL